jgi:hypothetical protein
MPTTPIQTTLLLWEKDTVMQCYTPCVLLVGYGGSVVIRGKRETQQLIERLQWHLECMDNRPIMPPAEGEDET